MTCSALVWSRSPTKGHPSVQQTIWCGITSIWWCGCLTSRLADYEWNVLDNSFSIHVKQLFEIILKIHQATHPALMWDKMGDDLRKISNRQLIQPYCDLIWQMSTEERRERYNHACCDILVIPINWVQNDCELFGSQLIGLTSRYVAAGVVTPLPSFLSWRMQINWHRGQASCLINILRCSSSTNVTWVV